MAVDSFRAPAVAEAFPLPETEGSSRRTHGRGTCVIHSPEVMFDEEEYGSDSSDEDYVPAGKPN